MKKNWILLLVILGFTGAGCLTSKRASQTDTLENSLLWRIEGLGIKKPSYLFGTIHIIDSKDYFLPKGTLSAIDASEKMVFEIDIDEMTDMGNLMGMMSKLMMDKGKTLKDILSKEDYELVSKYFEKMGMPIFLFERMKPFFLTMFAQEGFDPNGLKNGSMKSYEMEFSELAKEKEMDTEGLETIEFQLGLFDKITYEDQAKMLLDAIKSTKKDDGGEFDKMIKLYKNQNIDGLSIMIENGGEDVKGFNDQLLVKRNQSWVEPMIEIAKGKPTFFAVGAGHLGGKNGVIRLLRAKGIKVTAVK